jgi:hypothetical protein
MSNNKINKKLIYIVGAVTALAILYLLI